MKILTASFYKAVAHFSWKPSATIFVITVALFNTVIYHGPLYFFAVNNLDSFTLNGILTLTTLFFVVTTFTALFFSLLSLVSPYLLKPICMLACLCNAISLYFIATYGVVLDKSMMGNVFNSNLAEASSFFHPKLLLYFFALGVLPCWLLARTQVQNSSILRRFLLFFLIILFGAIWIYSNSKTWLWMDKNARKLGGMIVPWSYTINTIRYYANDMSSPHEQTLLPAARFENDEKTIVFLVIGESAREQNFSLYGYNRITNPLLKELGVIALANSHACATYTTASLLCMLSHVDTRWQLSASYEPLPSYLQRQGIDVIWRTNNWGEPSLKVQSYERANDLRRECEGSACAYDEVLLQGLEQRIRSSANKKIFVVLHQHGSHGPSYYRNYPKQFEIYKPACKSVDLHQCTDAELVSAYDNTILYTDYFLHQAIELLKTFPEHASMLMYISDHGESLGEHGIYLHGSPYSIAPDVQKNIPFLIWMSDTFKKANKISSTQLTQQTSHSDANVFHSIMGAFGMNNDIYNSQLDIFNSDAK